MAPVFWLLFEPKGVPKGLPCDTTESAMADTAKLSTVKFYFQEEGGTLVLHTSLLEMPDPWGVRPIQFFPELVCVHHQHVLIRIRSTGSHFHTLFYVYSFSIRKGDCDTVVKLPNVAPEIWASQSFGLVHSSDTYVVANLQREYNQVTKQLEVFLHRWRYSGSYWQSELNDKVTLPSGINIDMKWQPDQVIAFMDALLWVYLSQGVILRCKNPLEKGQANFDFIRLPCMKKVPRPQTYMSVGCCKGELKLVVIDDTSDVNTVYVTIMTFNKVSYERCINKWFSRQYWDTTSRKKSLICRDLWEAMKNMPDLQLPSNWNGLEKHMPCFPVLNTCNDNILHLIVATKDNTGAWLLQVNTQSWALEGAAAYPGFNHQKPPYSSWKRRLV